VLAKGQAPYSTVTTSRDDYAVGIKNLQWRQRTSKTSGYSAGGSLDVPPVSVREVFTTVRSVLAEDGELLFGNCRCLQPSIVVPIARQSLLQIQ